MKLAALLVCFALLRLPAFAQTSSAASISSALQQLSLDPNDIYHVRDLRIARGDLDVYLTDGFLGFTAPVAGRSVAAIFTTEGAETGDAEVVVTPPSRGERASLAYFTRTPNLDEHFNGAVFLFTDDLREEVLRHVAENDERKAPEQAKALAAQWNPVARNIAGDVSVPIVSSLLNSEPAARGVFYGVLAGRTLGPFDITYDPSQIENTTVGKIENGVVRSIFAVWTSFTARKSPKTPTTPPFTIRSYQMDVTIQPDLKVVAVTKFQVEVGPQPLKSLDLQISRIMKVTGASVNGAFAEVFQPASIRESNADDIGRFLVVAATPLPAGTTAEVEIRHEGNVIRNAGEDVYFVEARNIWFPHRPSNSATFDLTFRSPERLHVVSSGKLVEEKTDGPIRIVRRALQAPARFVGFNVGDFVSAKFDASPFHVESFANRLLFDEMKNAPVLIPLAPAPAGRGMAPPLRPAPGPVGDPLEFIAKRAGNVLREYLELWGPPPTTNVSVTPIPGTFGQGFPGLIYLSSTSYLPEAARPPSARGPLLDVFYSDILLPHEIAHQWWGNLVVPSDYRSGWLAEALANYAAWELFAKERGLREAGAVLRHFTAELKSARRNGTPMESAGPLDLGIRLRESDNADVWRVITYDKGTWVIRMLEQRMGQQAFRSFLKTLASEYGSKALSNEDFRKTAVRFLAKGDPDPTLELFFDAWVYGTGIPRLSLSRERSGRNDYTLTLTGTPAEYTLDIPLSVEIPGKPASRKWVRAGPGDTSFVVEGPASVRVSLPGDLDFLYFPETGR
jgi:hypothetical protein